MKSKMEKSVSCNVSVVFREQRVMLEETEPMKMFVSKVWEVEKEQGTLFS